MEIRYDAFMWDTFITCPKQKIDGNIEILLVLVAGTEMMDSQLMGEFEGEAKEMEADSWSLGVEQQYLQQLDRNLVKRQDVIYGTHMPPPHSCTNNMKDEAATCISTNFYPFNDYIKMKKRQRWIRTKLLNLSSISSSFKKIKYNSK